MKCMILFYIIILKIFSLTHTNVPHQCSFHIKNLGGFISTPNFPNPYPVPIICKWVIEAPPNHKIAVYFTQFYLKNGFRASDYAHYMPGIEVGVGKADFGVISSRDEPTYLVSNQRILVLSLQVYSLDNVHLRVTEHLLETYGFNITYEVLQQNETVRSDGCIYHHCSFTGFCMASEDLEEYRCQCVTGYFGDECQYDDKCGPTATSEVCYNGGTCRYYIGSSVRTCECPRGFEGAKCENRSKSNNVTVEAQVKCEGMHYTSHPDYIAIYPNNRMCPPKGKDLYVITAELNVTENSETEVITTRNELESSILKELSWMFFGGINVTYLLETHTELCYTHDTAVMVVKMIEERNAKYGKRSEISTEIHFIAESTSSENRRDIQNRLGDLFRDSFSVDLRYLDLRVQPMLFIERMEISEKMPVVEGMPLLLACIVRGGSDTKVKWLKDFSPIVFRSTHGRLWNSTIPKNSYDSFTFLLGFDKSHVLDSGTFTCVADDETGTDTLSLLVTVKQLAKPLLTPLAATLREKDPITITCVSQEVHRDRNVTYFWTKNQRPLQRTREQVEDLFPSGSRVVLKEAMESANYTCAIQSIYGIKRETSIIKVVSDEDFMFSTCHRETLYSVNWKLTAVGAEDIHICPSNYTGYITRRCIKGTNESTIWHEPDFSRCVSAPFRTMRNEFESYRMGYRTNSINDLLQKLVNMLADRMSVLHLSEAEPFVDILFNIESGLYIREQSEKNWKVILNMTSMLLNSNSVYRKQSKQKLYRIILDVSLEYGRQHLLKNSSKVFASPNLIVKIWKIPKDVQKLLFIPGHLHPSWRSDLLQLGLKMYNSSDSQGNSPVTVVLVIYKSFPSDGCEEFPNCYLVSPNVDSVLPVILTEAKCGDSVGRVPIQVSLAYKGSVRPKRNFGNMLCYKTSVIDSTQNLQVCENVVRSGKDIVCQCYSSGLLSVTLLEKQFSPVNDSFFTTKFKLLPIFGVVISILFLLYIIRNLGCKNKFSSLFA